MRKTLIYTFIFLLAFTSCQKDCNENPGKLIEKSIEVAFFENITIGQGVKLIVKESEETTITIKAGQNRFDNIHYEVSDKTFYIESENSCFLDPSFEPVEVYIGIPNLLKIRNAGEYSIVSEGVIHFPLLTLLCENNQSDYFNNGLFDLEIDNELVQTVTNGNAQIYLKGHTNHLKIGVYSGISFIDTKNLGAENVTIIHKGWNDVWVNPQVSLTGEIYGTGNVVSYNQPEIVDVETFFTGALLFN